MKSHFRKHFGIALGYAGWVRAARIAWMLSRSADASLHGKADCSGGIYCTTCPDPGPCGKTGCVRQVEHWVRPPRRSELVEIHRVVMHVGGEWPDDERDPYTLRHVKWMARQLKADADDASRFRWLTEDHADPKQREACRDLLDRMARLSYSAACMSIDVHRARTAGLHRSSNDQEEN